MKCGCICLVKISQVENSVYAFVFQDIKVGLCGLKTGVVTFALLVVLRKIPIVDHTKIESHH